MTDEFSEAVQRAQDLAATLRDRFQVLGFEIILRHLLEEPAATTTGGARTPPGVAGEVPSARAIAGHGNRDQQGVWTGVTLA